MIRGDEYFPGKAARTGRVCGRDGVLWRCSAKPDMAWHCSAEYGWRQSQHHTDAGRCSGTECDRWADQRSGERRLKKPTLWPPLASVLVTLGALRWSAMVFLGELPPKQAVGAGEPNQ
jgi:hypothetical protein